jgi:type IV secretion system protein VirB8
MAYDQFKKPQDKAKTDTKNWYSDRYQTVIVQRNILFVAALAALISTLVSSILIYSNIPLVTVEPFAIEVDKRTGIVQAVAAMDEKNIQNADKVVNHFLVLYTRARETVNIGDLAYNLNMVRVMSDPKSVFQPFTKIANPYDPSTNMGRLGTTGKRNLVVTNIFFLNKGHAQLRFISQESDTGNSGNLKADERWLVDIKYEFRELKLNPDEAFLNPVGFYVTSYDATKEAL